MAWHSTKRKRRPTFDCWQPTHREVKEPQLVSDHEVAARHAQDAARPRASVQVHVRLGIASGRVLVALEHHIDPVRIPRDQPRVEDGVLEAAEVSRVHEKTRVVWVPGAARAA